MTAPNKSLESFFEVFIKNGVDEGVDQRVEIAQPCQKVRHLHGSTARTAGVDDHLLDKKWQPTDDKGAYYQPQGGCRFALPWAGDPRSLIKLAPTWLAAWLVPARPALESFHRGAHPFARRFLGWGFRDGLFWRAYGLWTSRPPINITISGGVGWGDHAPIGHAWVTACSAGLPAHVEGLSSPVDFVVEDEDEQQGDVKCSKGGV